MNHCFCNSLVHKVAGIQVSLSYGQSTSQSNSAATSDTARGSTVKAGDGGFTVNVQGNTDLKGGAITSTQAAIDNNKNTFQTGGTLTTSDIENKASYEAKSMSVSIGTGAGSGLSIPGTGLSANLSGAGMGKDSGSTSSTTTAGISGIAGDTGKRTGDNAQGIGKIFDARQSAPRDPSANQNHARVCQAGEYGDSELQRSAKTNTARPNQESQRCGHHPRQRRYRLDESKDKTITQN